MNTLSRTLNSTVLFCGGVLMTIILVNCNHEHDFVQDEVSPVVARPLTDSTVEVDLSEVLTSDQVTGGITPNPSRPIPSSPNTPNLLNPVGGDTGSNSIDAVRDSMEVAGMSSSPQVRLFNEGEGSQKLSVVVGEEMFDLIYNNNFITSYDALRAFDTNSDSRLSGDELNALTAISDDSESYQLAELGVQTILL